MLLIQITLGTSILLCALVAGLVFTFAIIVMPGIKSLADRDFLRTFVVMDRVIQNNQPVFIFVWLGSAVSVVTLAILGIWQLDGLNRVIAVFLPAIYLLGVQLPTFVINIPLNNQLQQLDLDRMSEVELSSARREFESRWTRWNSIRTVLATMVSAGLIFLAFNLASR